MNFAIPSAGAMPVMAGARPLATASSSATSTPEHRKLTDAAQQFEGMLLQEMLKPMKEHGFCQEENEDKDEGSGFADTLSSFGTEAVATAIAKSGGLGIAKRVVSQVEGEKASHQTGVAHQVGSEAMSTNVQKIPE
jgi:Rod binding domain-containing protein